LAASVSGAGRKAAAISRLVSMRQRLAQGVQQAACCTGAGRLLRGASRALCACDLQPVAKAARPSGCTSGLQAAARAPLRSHGEPRLRSWVPTLLLSTLVLTCGCTAKLCHCQSVQQSPAGVDHV
jgi:hypothetical protein